MPNMPRRTVAAFRMDPEAQELAKEQAEKLGLSMSRYVELIILFAGKPELMDTWIEMLIAFKKSRREMLKHAKK